MRCLHPQGAVRWLAVIFLLGGFSLLARAEESQAPVDPRLAQIQFHVLAAELAGQRGDTKTAAEEYFKAVELSDDPALAERATRVALFAEDEALALRAADAWIKRAPAALEAREIALGLSLAAGRLSDARDHANTLIRLNPQGEAEAFRQIVRVLGAGSESARPGFGILREVAARYPQLPEAHYAVGLLALRLERTEEAVVALDRALALRSGWQDALVIKTSALVRLNRLDEAEQTILQASGSDEERAALHLTYARLLLEAERESAAREQFQRVLELSPGQADALQALALMSLSSGNKAGAYDYYKQLYERDPERRDEAAYYLGIIDEERGDYEAALLWYAKVVDGAQVFPATQRRAYMLYKLGQLPRARSLLKRYREKNPDAAAQTWFTEAGLLYEAGEYTEASAVYDAALKKHPDEPELIYGRSLVSERLGRVAMAEQDLRRLLQLDPNDARALNALGYILSNYSERYGEARKYIESAYAQNPEDPAINDSMGWIQYRLGNLDSALHFLRIAYKKLPDPEVAAHLGEVLWKLGERNEAQVVWRQAMAEAPEHPVLRETVTRLTR
ncbi:MAG: tetratricopeptide repeat protein [Nevskiales bacterium]